MANSGELCCALFRALSLEPVPVIDDMVYVPGAEGFRLTEMMSVTPCPTHRFNFAHTVGILLMKQYTASAPGKKRCPCVQRTERKPIDKGVLRQVDHVRRDSTIAGCRNVSGKGVLWALEISPVVTAYKWILQNLSKDYTKCCEAVVVYQLKKSRWLPPGLYVYRKKPAHFGCTVERPIAVIEQFNFNRTCAESDLPNAITIDIFPGCNNYSAMYIVMRKQSRLTPEYGNRLFGEATAMGLMDLSHHPPEGISASERYEVAIRTDRMYVLDMRWRAFDTRTACVQAIPKIKNMKAIFWSNHTGNVQETECKVLSWIFGHSNELPLEVNMVDYTAQNLEVRYMLVDMNAYSGELPQPPRRDMSFFVHTFFDGDETLALDAMGVVTSPKSRMGSPCSDNRFAFWYALPTMGSCHPTPYTCGDIYAEVTITDKIKHDLIEWTLGTDGADCQGLAVQHTLYYHCDHDQFKMMVCHTVQETDNSLHMFRL